MKIVNQQQYQYWDGEAGAIWVRLQQRLDALLAPFTEASIASLGSISGKRVLDLGCGCGDSAVQLASLGADVLGIDLSRPMLAQANARRRLPDNPRFEHADGALFSTQQPFDLMYSRFGAMFFEEPIKAFENLLQVLRPGGELRLVCWQAPKYNPWMSVAGKAIAPWAVEVEPPRDPRGPGPFAFSDQQYVQSLLEQSGFADLTFTEIKKSLQVASNLEDAVAFQQSIGPAARVFKSLPDASLDAAIAAMSEALLPFVTATGVVMEGAVWLIAGKRN